jgi:hypothetical protein
MKRAIPLFLLGLLASSVSAQPLCDFLFRDSIGVVIIADTVAIWDFAACGYCSSSFVPSVTLSGDSIYIVQTDTTSDRTTCTCLFDLQTTIMGLPSGTYTVVITRDYRPPQKFIRSFELQYTGVVPRDLSYSSFQSGCLPTSVSDTFLDFPREYVLEQNYPNPFNPNTTVRFQTPTTELVTIKVFDILGRHVQTLVEEVKPPGFYSIRFEPAPGVSSGIYVCRMVAGPFTQTRVMILLR